MRIGIRLGIGFSVVLLFSVIIGLVGYNRLSVVSKDVDYMVTVPITNKSYANLWLRVVYVNAANTVAALKSDSSENKAYFNSLTDKDAPVLADLVKRANQSLQTATPQEADIIRNILAMRLKYIDARKAVIKELESTSGAESDSFINQHYMPVLNTYIDSIRQLNDYYNQSLNEAKANTDKSFGIAATLIFSCIVLSLLIGAWIAYVLTKGITRPLSKAVSVADAVAKGDLTSELAIPKHRDETGMLLISLKHMQDNLKTTIEKILLSAESINVSSGEVATGNLDLSSRTEQQASSLEETASSMEELTATVKQNADNAAQAYTLAQQSTSSAKDGQTVITQVVETMHEITASSHKMEEIINVIDGIAFQTNILALNAAVEAARAGEQGRGFAVVATEVRNLAQRSASAAKEIKTLIDTSVMQIQKGSSLTNDAGNAMTAISQGAQRSADVIAEISAASKEQSAGIEQVNQAVMHLDQVTQQNASLVEESAAAADSMRTQSEKLVHAVSMFKLGAHAMTLAKTPQPPLKKVNAASLALAAKA